MDNLKKWAENTESGKDIYPLPDRDIWSNIEKELNRQERPAIRFMPYLKVAASILILFVFALSFIVVKRTDLSAGYSLSDLSPDLADTEVYYAGLLDEKLSAVKASGKEIDPIIYRDLDQMDSSYQELMKDLRDNADNEEVIDAMIQNYRIRIEMLEAILEKINTENEPLKEGTAI